MLGTERFVDLRVSDGAIRVNTVLNASWMALIKFVNAVLVGAVFLTRDDVVKHIEVLILSLWVIYVLLQNNLLDSIALLVCAVVVLLLTDLRAWLLILHVYQIFIQQLLEIVIEIGQFLFFVSENIAWIFLWIILYWRCLIVSRAHAFLVHALEVLYLVVNLELQWIDLRSLCSVFGHVSNRWANDAQVQLRFDIITLAILSTLFDRWISNGILVAINSYQLLEVVPMSQVDESAFSDSTRWLLDLNMDLTTCYQLIILTVPCIISKMLCILLVGVVLIELLIPRFGLWSLFPQWFDLVAHRRIV